MHPSNLSRRRFFTLSGLAAAGALLPRAIANACPTLEAIDPAVTIATAINRFAADLHGKLAKKQGSLFFSPLSIETALAMTSAGARGQTLDEMRKVLHLPTDPHAAFGDLLNGLNELTRCKSGYQLTTANAIWAQKGYPWRKEFKELVGRHYGAGVVETNFAEPETARKQINDWVERATHEKIKDLIPSGVITALTRMVLTNAVYFKGSWRFKFDPKQTKDAAFHHADGTKADVPMMSQSGEFEYGEFDLPGPAGNRVQVLNMPYAGEKLSMTVYLPRDANGTGRLATVLSGADLGQPRLAERRVNVSLPRFKAETDYSLKPVLMDLGMNAAFGGADFSGMHTGSGSPYISHVLHKAFVEVTEEGTEAAAATAVVIKERAGAPDESVAFRADRPFVFTIRDNKTGAVLFLGRYAGPKA